MSSMKKQEEQTKNICLLKKDGFTLYLVFSERRRFVH